LKLLVELSERQFRQIQRLLDDGRYESVASFVSAAVENQLLLETDTSTFKSNTMVGFDLSVSAWDGGAGRHPRAGRLEAVGMPSWWTELRQAVNAPVDSVELTDDLYEQCDVFPITAGPNDMLPGLISRLLPVKFAARVLYSGLAALGQPTIRLETFLDRAGQYALWTGDWLAKQDELLGRRREEAISTGFPRSSRDAAKSVERYRSLFLASIRSKEQKADGALLSLKLAVLKKRGAELHICLTDAGSEFARMFNPVIDGEQPAQEALSLDERRFIIRHVRHWVPGEYRATRLVLDALGQGVVERNALNRLLAKVWPDWSPDQVNSWRSGLLSRMSELGLLERNREGRALEYRVSESATELLGS